MKQILFLLLSSAISNLLIAQKTVDTPYCTNNNGFVANNFTEKFDNKNRLIEKQYCIRGKASKTTYEYNSNNQKIAENDFSANGDLERHRTYHYNQKGLLVQMKSSWTNDDGEFIDCKEDYGYNRDKELIIKTFSSNEYGISDVWSYEIKKINNEKYITETFSNIPTGNSVSETTVYDNNGLEIKKIHGYKN